MGQFSELKKVAAMLQGKYETIFKFSTSHTNTLENINYCGENGYVCYDNNGGIHGTKRKRVRDRAETWFWHRSNLISKGLHRIYWRLRKIPIFLFFFVEYERSIILPNRVLREIDPSLVILSEESIIPGSVGYIKSAKKLGISTLIVPFTLGGHEEQASWMQYYEQFHMTNIYNRIVGFLFPSLVCEYRGRKFLRRLWYECIADKILQVIPPLPWEVVSGEADAVAVESLVMQKLYQDAGVDPMKLRLTGSLNDDLLYAGMQKRKKKRRPTILVAFPPDHTYVNSVFMNYEEVVAFWVDALRKVKGWNIVIRPHPKTRLADLESFFKAGFTMSLENTASLIPACDLYIASVSATIRWAIACGKPVINYDVYGLVYKDYENTYGVLTLNTKSGFEYALQNINELSKELAELQKEDAHWWGKLDGKAGERMMTLIDQLVARKK